MKKIYSAPKLTIVKIKNTDIITLSSANGFMGTFSYSSLNS